MYQDTGWQHESSMPSFLNVERVERPLRPHQEKAIAMLRQSIARGNKRVVIQLPTGAGKTRLAAEIVNGSLSKGNRAAFTVPMISLIDQTCDAFENEGIHDIGVIQSSHWRTNYAAQVQVASVQSLIRRSFPEAKIVLVDECHVRAKAIEDWMEKCPDTIFVGLSATPWAKGMAEQWDDLICPVTMQELIDDGFLSKFVVYTPDHPDLKGIKTVAGDYHEGQLSERMQDTVLVANIVETWKQLGENEPTLVFAVDRAHARKLVGKFAEAGINMGYCDANVDRVERQMLFERMARGELAGIVNIATLTTGVDADVRCIVLARPTKSAMLQCLDSETEILTSRGWLGMGEVKEGDVVASCREYDRMSGAWSRVLSVIEREMAPEERWIEYDAPRANFRVTSGHTMIASRESGGEYGPIRADEMAVWKGSVFMPTAVHMDQRGLPLSDEELYFIGMMMADGYWTSHSGCIYQSERHPEILQKIEETLMALGISFRKSPINPPKEGEIKERHRRWRFAMSTGSPKVKIGVGRFAPKEDSVRFQGDKGFHYLMPFLDKDLSPALLSLSRSQFEKLLDGIWDGDGEKKKSVDYTPRSRTICTSRKVMADRLQALGAINGYTVHSRMEHKSRVNPIYILTFTPKDWRSCGGYAKRGANPRPAIISKPPTREKVWCVETELGSIVTRRRGKVTVMGNCQIIGRGLRTAKGKERCIILDHAGNHDYFGGYVTELGETELLSGKVDREPKQKEKSEDGQAEGKNCPKCGAWKPPKVSICPSCGFKPERQSDIEEVEGRLKEFKPKKKKGDGVDKERFYRELLGYAALKGKSESWTLAMFKNKFDEWPYRKHGVEPITPTPQTISYIRSRNIAYAKSKRRGG